jgi:predicted phage-related endonuclease
MVTGGYVEGSGFTPDERKSAWWATDSRRAVSGHFVDVILEKLGKKERDDLSDIEAVQMGLVMQPVIGKLFEDQTGIKVRDLDIAGTYDKEPWLRAHGDFETDDGGLLEVKNFNAAALNKYPDMDANGDTLPLPDLVQCVHEAIVFNKPHVWFAVLFGGQAFRYWKIDVTDIMREDFIKRAAVWWSHAVTGTMPTPETPDQARSIFPIGNDASITANAQIETVCNALKDIKARIKDLEEKESEGLTYLQQYLGDKNTLLNVQGEILATWKNAKSSKKFDAKRFQSEMPDLYDRFCSEVPGSRRFLLK